jgi:hypothetical protein
MPSMQLPQPGTLMVWRKSHLVTFLDEGSKPRFGSWPPLKAIRALQILASTGTIFFSSQMAQPPCRRSAGCSLPSGRPHINGLLMGKYSSKRSTVHIHLPVGEMVSSGTGSASGIGVSIGNSTYCWTTCLLVVERAPDVVLPAAAASMREHQGWPA